MRLALFSNRLLCLVKGAEESERVVFIVVGAVNDFVDFHGSPARLKFISNIITLYIACDSNGPITFTSYSYISLILPHEFFFNLIKRNNPITMRTNSFRFR